MYKKIKIIILIVIINVAYFNTVGFGQNINTEVVILHVNDMHANIDNLPKLAYIVKQYRAQYKNVILVSAGDMFSGNPYVDMTEEKGKAIIDLMNHIGFDLVAIGNHEFDYTQEVLNKRMAESKFPYICANIINKGGKLMPVKPYHKFRFNDSIDIFFIGLIETLNGGKPSTHPDKLDGLKFTNALKAEKKFKNLRDSAECYIALSHLGVDIDSLLAKQSGYYDIIIGAHSHTLIQNPVYLNNVLITQAGANLKKMGVIKLQFENHLLKSKDYSLVDIENFEDIDIITAKIMNRHKDNEYLNQIVGKTESGINGLDELGCWFTDAVKEITGADVAFQNNGGLRLSKIEPGNISIYHIYSLDPFSNKVVVLTMKGKQIKKLIENSYKKRNTIELQVSGLSYKIFTDKNNKIIRIELYDTNNQIVSNNTEFSVALNTYLFKSFGIKYKKLQKKYDKISADMILEYTKKHKTIEYSNTKRAFNETINN